MSLLLPAADFKTLVFSASARVCESFLFPDNEDAEEDPWGSLAASFRGLEFSG